MRFLYTLVALLVGQAAVAIPITHAGMDLINHSVNPQYDVVAALDSRELEKRTTCQTVNHVIRTIGTSRNLVTFYTLATILARQVCEYVNGYKCLELSNIIVLALNLIYSAASHYSGAQAEILSGARKRNYGDIHTGYSVIDSGEEILQRRDGDPALVSRVLLAGLTGSHSPNTKQDIIVNHFADGNTLLHLPIGESSTDNRGKRVPPGSGFKISYTTRSKSRLSYSKQQEMSGFIAAAWAAASEAYDMTDFIGLAQDGYNVNFYYRVIPEVRGFGLNYESVDICGGMGDFLFGKA
ncbi:uncharacterized protein TrAtP1_013131 [Trichoderma atroviride]|uniref:uncharacterized protein n=1 Tax=Hypocrea atroviridis TaxID=63577 RepID=UPI00332A0B19|nr:hypothetical protein TrAtP1_013131 [Trichoderma atroviride]